MKTCHVSIPIGKGEKISGIIKLPDGFESSKTVGIILATVPETICIIP